MNTNKFRAWDTRNEEFVYSVHDDCFYINTRGVLFMYAIPKSESGLETIYHKSYDVDQFTGFQDSNGVDIYFNDHVIIYGYGVLEIEGLCDLAELLDACAENDIGEIVGNAYENKESK